MQPRSAQSTVRLVGPEVTVREFDQADFEAVHAYARDTAPARPTSATPCTGRFATAFRSRDVLSAYGI